MKKGLFITLVCCTFLFGQLAYTYEASSHLHIAATMRQLLNEDTQNINYQQLEALATSIEEREGLRLVFIRDDLEKYVDEGLLKDGDNFLVATSITINRAGFLANTFMATILGLTGISIKLIKGFNRDEIGTSLGKLAVAALALDRNKLAVSVLLCSVGGLLIKGTKDFYYNHFDKYQINYKKQRVDSANN